MVKLVVTLQGPSIAPVLILNSLVGLSAALVPRFIEVGTADFGYDNWDFGCLHLDFFVSPESLSSDVVCLRAV